jgi:DNA polymerase gamma 1
LSHFKIIVILELWIASIIGDSNFTKIHGSTAVSWMNLQGKKSDGTDIHSKTANMIGITRDQAKVFNYGRIYGAGKMFAQKLLLQFNPLLTDEVAETKAKKMFDNTKGRRNEEKKWEGGTESEMLE